MSSVYKNKTFTSRKQPRDKHNAHDGDNETIEHNEILLVNVFGFPSHR